MAFVDSAKIYVQSGAGGKGCISFYTDMFLRGKKRPDGGDGGNGGDVIAVADAHLQTLLDYRFKQHYNAKNGTHGSSQGKTGRTGESCILRFPCGTLLYDEDTGLLIKELLHHGDEVVLAKGGRAGTGNIHKKRERPNQPGIKRWVRLDLKVIADVGLVGFPNAGKSTLVCAVSNVKSKIANYPFTTKQPILGYVQDETGEHQCVMADLPGLIEGAHLGKGLGHQFLKHAERTKILVHVVDMSGADGRDPLYDYEQICEELDQYSHELQNKHKIVVANKMDGEGAKDNLERFKQKFDDTIFPISALEHKGLENLLDEVFNVLEKKA